MATKKKGKKPMTEERMLSFLEEVYLSCNTGGTEALASIAAKVGVNTNLGTFIKKMKVIDHAINEESGKKKLLWIWDGEPDKHLAQIIILAKKKADLDYWNKKQAEKKEQAEAEPKTEPKTEPKQEKPGIVVGEKVGTQKAVKVDDLEKAVLMFLKDVYLFIKQKGGKGSLNNICKQHNLSTRFGTALLEGNVVSNVGKNRMNSEYIWNSAVEPTIYMARETIKRKKAVDDRYEESKKRKQQEKEGIIENRLKTFNSEKEAKKREFIKHIEGVTELRHKEGISPSLLLFLKANNYHPHDKNSMPAKGLHSNYVQWCVAEEMESIKVRDFTDQIGELTNIKFKKVAGTNTFYLTQVDMGGQREEDKELPVLKESTDEEPVVEKIEPVVTQKLQEPVQEETPKPVEVVETPKPEPIKEEPKPEVIEEPVKEAPKPAEQSLSMAEQVTMYRAFLLDLLELTEAGIGKRKQALLDIRKEIRTFMKDSLGQ